ncbi:MAG TPA: protein-methionine-sulfoxide reductase heme-binding subunit MsrQ [Candidatus Competibacteraceae bacterium]|nr:protein-methionine-sulfoxide reductase heme-binding subunit MsrQ [Candidatus Competibacteraceae bacterium]
MPSIQRINRIGKPAVFCAALLPLAGLIHAALGPGLGANPVETITRFTGDWTLRFLLLTLALTPLRLLAGWSWPLHYRRMLGLFTFFYAALHFATYLLLDLTLDWGALAEDIAKRPYITVGFSAFVLLVPLAVTSTNGWMRRLGRNWKRLHRLVYPLAVLGVLHFLWLVKADVREPLLYATLLALLLGVRLVKWLRTRRTRLRPGARLPLRTRSAVELS